MPETRRKFDPKFRVYDKRWQLDITWAEVEHFLDDGVVVETTEEEEGRTKRFRLLEGWKRPLHVVEVVDDEQELIVYVTIYEPDLNHWMPGFRERRRL